MSLSPTGTFIWISILSDGDLPEFNAFLSKVDDQTSVGKNAKKREAPALWVGMQISAATVKNSLQGPQKIKNETALWPSDATSGNIFKETQNTNLKEYRHPYIYYSVMYNSQDTEATQVPINRQVDKKRWWYVALARWLSWLEHHPRHQSVLSSVPGQGIYLGCRFDPQLGHIPEATHRCLSPSSPTPFLSKVNKHLLGED